MRHAIRYAGTGRGGCGRDAVQSHLRVFRRRDPVEANDAIYATYVVMLRTDNSQTALKPAVAARVQIVTARRDTALRAPDAALLFLPKGVAAPVPSAGESLLWILRDGERTPVLVRLGLNDGQYSEVIDG